MNQAEAKQARAAFAFQTTNIKRIVQEFQDTGVWNLTPPTEEQVKTHDHWVEQGIDVITPWDQDFPMDLIRLGSPSLALFAQGKRELLGEAFSLGLGVVGAREPTEHAKHFAHHQLAYLNERVIVVSGLARGIDELAHRNWPGKQIIVIPTGLHHIYPSKNRDLVRELLHRDCLLVSPVFPEVSTIVGYSFCRRNSVIAAIARGCYVPSCGKTSGALMTARKFAALGKPVWTVPTDPRLGSGLPSLVHDCSAQLCFDGNLINQMMGLESRQRRHHVSAQPWEIHSLFPL